MRFVLFDYTGWKLCFIHSCLDKTLDKNITNVYWRNQTLFSYVSFTLFYAQVCIK